MTTPPVAEAAERLRAALADVEAGRKAKLYPADVRALLEHYDRHAETTEPEPPDVPAQQPAEDDSGDAQLADLMASLVDIRDALDAMQRPGFDIRMFKVLLPFANAILHLLNREIDEMKRQKVEAANEAYKALEAGPRQAAPVEATQANDEED